MTAFVGTWRKVRERCVSAAGTLMLATGILLMGANTASAEEAIELPEGSVHGVSVRERMDKDVYPVTVIDASRFAGRAMDLNEVINRAVGVKVRASGGEGSSALINIRGLEGQRVKLYINGKPLNTPDGSFGINDLPLELIERIEIYKGAVPARFGGDGLGGAVNVVLKEEHHGYTDVSYGVKSLGNHTGYLIHKKIWSDWGVELGLGGFGTLANNRYSMPREGAPPVMRDHDAFRSLTGGFGLTFRKLGLDEIEIEGAQVHSYKELQGVPGFNQGGTERNFRHAATRNGINIIVLNIEDDAFLLPQMSMDYSLARVFFRTRFTDTSSYIHDFDGNRNPSPGGRGEVGFGPNMSDNRRSEVRQRVTLGHPIPAGVQLTLHNDLLYSEDRPRDDLADANAGGKVSGYPGDLLATTTSVTIERGLTRSRLKLTGSFKHHYFHSSGHLSDPWGMFTGAADRVVQEKHEFGANAGVRYDLFRDFWVKASVERAHRLPNAEELFGDGFAVIGSAGLKPESSTNIDLGVMWDKTLPDRRRFRAEMSGYYSRLENLIKLTGTFAPNYANVAEARIMGVDGELNGDLLTWFYVYVNGTYLDARDVGRYVPGTRQENFTRDLRLPNMPYLFGNAGVELHGKPVSGRLVPDFRLFWDANAMHEFFYEFEVSRYQEKRVHGYLVQTAGLQAGFQNDRFTISAEIENLTNENRRDQFSNPLPGRIYRAKTRVTVF
jgi:vitamin B12 transporter